MKNLLEYVCDDEGGIFRKRKGRGFIYLDNSQKILKDKKILERIKSLVIPPNWKDVWICAKENGHLQATGIDEKGRKQYIYHEVWTEFRQQSKFGRMSEFARKLPLIRAQTAKDLKRKEWDKKKVVALVIEIMDEYNLRIGNTYYREENGTYGVSNLRKKHLKQVGGHLELNFKAKSGKYRHVEIEDKEWIKLIKECSEIPGYELFKYQGADNKMHAIDSQDVNEYLKEVSAEDFSSKDFRTWNASVLAVEHFVMAQAAVKENPKLKFKTALVKRVAEEMGNTASVCENYYIHPFLLECICNGKTKLPTVKSLDAEYQKLKLETEEKIALYFIDKAPKEDNMHLENLIEQIT